MSPAYKYVRGQVILGKFSKDDLIVLVSRKVITEEERLDLEKLYKE